MGFFEKLKNGLMKTKSALVNQITSVFSGFSAFDDDFFEELEETLILADMGVGVTESVIEELKEKIKADKIKVKEMKINIYCYGCPWNEQFRIFR